MVANEWKDANDKVMPVKQWLEERRVLQVISWRDFCLSFYIKSSPPVVGGRALWILMRLITAICYYYKRKKRYCELIGSDTLCFKNC